MTDIVCYPFDYFFINHTSSTKKTDMTLPHFHDAYEIYLQISGKRFVQINDKVYELSKGHLIIIPPFAIHFTMTPDNITYERYVTNFLPEHLNPFLNNSEISILMEFLNDVLWIELSTDQFNTMHQLFKDLHDSSVHKGFLSDKLFQASLLRFIMFIRSLTPIIKHTQEKNLQHEISHAIDYINTHFKNSPSLDDIASSVHLSKYHFSRLFRKSTGQTYLNYLNNVRLLHAHRLLIQTALSFSEIAEKTGFTSAAQFGRVFKNNYGISPMKFRQDRKKNFYK